MTTEIPVILLVEGDIVARSPLAQYLRKCRFRVVEAVNAEEAKIALEASELNIQVVLADIDTEGGGFALTQWIRAENLDVQVILSGSPDKIVDRAGRLCLDGPALVKPYEHHLVRDQIHRAIARRDRGLRATRADSCA